jgi:hypothetical protein
LLRRVGCRRRKITLLDIGRGYENCDK